MKITLDKARELLEAMGYEVAEQAEQEPVGVVTKDSLDGVVKWNGWIPREGTKLYAAPVRTKDLTDDEIANTLEKTLVVEDERFEFQGGRILTIRESELLPTARAIIEKFKEKNK